MTTDTAFEALVDSAREILGLPEDQVVTRADSLRDLGANSVDRADIITDAMEELGVWTALVSFADAQNLGELADVLEQKAGQE